MSDQPQPHPIVDHALIQLLEKPDKSFEFKPGGVDHLKSLLLQLGDGEWIRAAQDLTKFAYYLEKEARSPQAAADILLALEVLAPRLVKVREQVQSGAHQAIERASGNFQKLKGPEPKQIESDKEKFPAKDLHRNVKG